MRRELVIKRMEQLEAAGMGCSGCQGNCCTFEANSMMVTPLEAIELMPHVNDEFIEKCRETIIKFRLNHPSGNGRRSFIRRTYTCPYFNHKELGCPLPREVKPYGCLAFNAHHAELKAGEHCYSEKELLVKREELHPDEVVQNEELRKKFGIFWEKTPLPLALVELWEKLNPKV